MTTHRPYNRMDASRHNLSEVFDDCLSNKNVSEMILLLGMMPLNDIKLEALSQWNGVGFDLILNTPRLQQHQKYSEFVRTYFRAACQELNSEEIQRFAPFASESDQLEGFLFVLMDNIKRTEEVFKKPHKEPSSASYFEMLYEDINNPHKKTDEKRKTALSTLIGVVSTDVLQQVSQTLQMQNNAMTNNPKMNSHTILNDCAMQVQNEILARVAQDASNTEHNKPDIKRKM